MLTLREEHKLRMFENRVLRIGGERNHCEDPGVDGRITLRWIFKK
jgi:hypothetical protein